MDIEEQEPEQPQQPNCFQECLMSFQRLYRNDFKYRLLIYLVVVLFLLTIIIFSAHWILRSIDNEEGFYRETLLKTYDHGAAVCSDASVCSAIGRDILMKTDNAVDAAIAALFCNGLYTMQSMGIGGGSMMIIHRKQRSETVSLNAREVAPLNAYRDMFKGNATLSKSGGLALAVPGELKGYLLAHERYGSNMSWYDIIEPTYKICMDGYRLTKHQYDSVLLSVDGFKSDETLRSMFYEKNTKERKPIGSLIKPPIELCNTLKEIMENGPETFYTGPLSEKFVQDAQDLGGILTMEDMKQYKAKLTAPVSTTFGKNFTVFSSPLPGSGMLLTFILKMLDGYKIDSSSFSDHETTILTTHRIIEAYKHAFAFRSKLGDYQFDSEHSDAATDVAKLIQRLTSDQYAREMRSKIKDNSTSQQVEDYGDGAVFYNNNKHGTSHLSVIAKNGDAVSVTSSVNVFFGASVLGKRTGILFNNGMDDFSNPGYDNYFGLKPSPTNFIVPGKSAMSSMTPTIVLDHEGNVKLAVGAAGGPMITTTTAYVILRHLNVGDNLKDSLLAYRFHHQLTPMVAQLQSGFPNWASTGLANIGHKVEIYKARGSVVCAVGNMTNQIYGNADYRKDGDVCGYDATGIHGFDADETICY